MIRDVQRAIITGGAGFIGSHLTRRLQDVHPAADLLVVDDLRGGHFSNLTEPRPDLSATYRGRFVAAAVGDIDWPALIATERPDAVFHLASITDTTVDDQRLMMRDNADAFERLLAACHAARVPLVWASSAATYGTQANGATAARRPFIADDAGRPANVYGFSKWIMENMHRRVADTDPDYRIVGLRYFNVFGPGEAYKGRMASMIGQLARQVIAGRPPRIFYDGEQARDQVAVADVVDATIAAAAAPGVGAPGRRSGIYNVGSGRATTFNEIVTLINEALGTSHEPEYFENPYAFYQDYTCADLSETTAGLNWRPERDPRAAIVEYVRWLAEHDQSARRDGLIPATAR